MRTSILIVALSLLALSCVAGKPGATIGVGGVGTATDRPAARKPSPRPIDYPALKAALEAPGSTPLLLDVRTEEEFDSGHIPGAILAPFDALESTFAEPDKNRPLVVYCRSGRRSAIAAETLARMGYTDIADLGGIDRWKGALRR